VRSQLNARTLGGIKHHEAHMSPSWPFADAPNTTTITTIHVLDGSQPIVLVSHDADDGIWQFLCGTTNDPHEGRVVGLDCIVDLDPSVAELADLPLGWRAWREHREAPWCREQVEDE
jgi:hypothetical protein